MIIVSSLTWLENNLFLSIHNLPNDPTSVYHIITREPPSSFSFQKLADPVEPFGVDKPPQHTILRLRDFPPELQDLLVVSSTASSDIGLLSRSNQPLTTDQPANLVTGVFTTTELLDDTKRPTLPMTDSMEDSVPIGVALDLSSKEKVYKPIPADEELRESATPLPGLCVLTHEGVLCSWWVVYTDSVTKGLAYPGLAAASDSNATASAAPQAAPAAASAFGAPASTNAFGSSSAAPAAPAFGASSQLGQKSSPWGAPAASNAPASGGAGAFGSGSAFGSSAAPSSNTAFGQPSTIGFGQSSSLGMRKSPWATGGSSAAPAFGQSGFASFASKNTQSPFGGASSASTPADPPASGGFAGFANKSGFASVSGNDNSNGGSVFGSGSKPAVTPFGASSGTTPAANPFASKKDAPAASPFGAKPAAPTMANPFASKEDKPSSSPFAATKSSSTAPNPFAPKTEESSGSNPFGSTPFKLESSFKPDPSAKDDAPKPSSGSSMFGSGFSSALADTSNTGGAATPSAKDEDMDASESSDQTPQADPRPQQSSLFSPKSDEESTTPTTTPAPSRFGSLATPAAGSSLFGQPSKPASFGSGGSLFGSNSTTPSSKPTSIFGQPSTTPKAFEEKEPEPKIKQEEEVEAPLPPDATSKMTYPLGDSSASSAASSVPSQPYGVSTTPARPEAAPLPPFSSSFKSPQPASDAPLPPDFTAKPKAQPPADAPLPPDFTSAPQAAEKPQSAEEAPLPPDFTKPTAKASDAPLPPDPAKSASSTGSSFVLPKAPSKESSQIPSVPEESEEESDLGDDLESEGSGIDVGKDLSPNVPTSYKTPGITPESSFGGPAGITPGVSGAQKETRPLFGEVSRNAPIFGRPSANENSPRSPSPIRGAVPNRVVRGEASRSVSAPGVASQILGSKQTHQQLGNAASRGRQGDVVDPFMLQHRKLREKQEAEETQPLVDEEDDEVQKILASEVDPTLELDEFIAHTNAAPPAKDSVPAQVEAVYRDINSMIDTLGLNARAITAFTKGHTEYAKEDGRTPDDLEIPDDWVLCEVSDLGDVLEEELHADLESGRVQESEDKILACQELTREVHRLRAKQDDLRRVILSRMDPDQADIVRTLPLSAEQSAQQNELRRESAQFSKLLSEAEEALTLLKARIASASGSSGRAGSNVPTVEAVMRTITKMTSMVEKRSGDVDVLETQLRKMRLGSAASREGSPFVTPTARRSIMLSPDSTPSRNLRQSISSAAGFGASVRATPPRKKMSGFSKEEKGDLMDKRVRRQAVLDKLKTSVEKRGVNVWNLEDVE